MQRWNIKPWWNIIQSTKAYCSTEYVLIQESHQDEVKCKQLARDIRFSPGTLSQIEDKMFFMRPVSKSSIKGVNDNSRLLWQTMFGSDLFECNRVYYLLYVDYYSKWIEFVKLDNVISSNIRCHLKSQFARHGISDELIGDNGSQYASSVFTNFSNSYSSVHTTWSLKRIY